jgi:hypothetical protein
MVDEGYNTHSVIRQTLGMGDSLPEDDVITNWVNLIDGMIEQYKSSPSSEIAAIIEMNRLSSIYWELKKTNKQKLEIAPLSQEEKDMLDDIEDRTVWWE